MSSERSKVKRDEFNERIRQIRERLDVTQEEFGRPLGLDWFSVRDLESGKKRVTPALIVNIEINHSINSHWMLTGEGNMFLKEGEIEGSPYLYKLTVPTGTQIRKPLFTPAELEELQTAIKAVERDSLIRKIVVTLEDMPLEKRREVLSIAEEKKLLSQLMKERAAQKPGATF